MFKHICIEMTLIFWHILTFLNSLDLPSGAGTSAKGALASDSGVAHLADSMLSSDKLAVREADDELEEARSQVWRYVREQSQLRGFPET